MSSLTRVLPRLVVASLMLTVAVDPAIAASAPSADVPAFAVAEQRIIDIPDSQLLKLSPDGTSIAVSRPAGPSPTELCIHDAETLDERVCTDLDDLDAGLWADSLVWSPDGKWLAFAELWPQFFIDGDLWLLNATTGALTNLLDDRFSGGLIPAAAADTAITLPSYPAFTPDSAAVTFSRAKVQDDGFGDVDVASVSIAGGDVTPVGDLRRGRPVFDYLSKMWTADGSRLFVSLVEYADSGLGPESGIWVFETGGDRARQLLRVDEPDDWPPRIVAVSPHGERLLVLYPRYRVVNGTAPAYALIDGTTGAIADIAPLLPDDRAFTPITGAMLSPDGTALITVSGRGEKQVAVRDVAGSDEKVLLADRSASVPSDLGGEVLTWARDDSVLVSGSLNGRGTLLVLDPDSRDRS